jgi:hypothetical protein
MLSTKKKTVYVTYTVEVEYTLSLYYTNVTFEQAIYYEKLWGHIESLLIYTSCNARYIHISISLLNC